MEEHEPTGELKLLLERYRLLNGEVEYVLIDSDLDVGSDEVHRIAVWFGLMVVNGRLQEAWARSLSEFPGHQPYAARIDPSKQIVSCRERVSDFLKASYQSFGNLPSLSSVPGTFAITHEEMTTLFGQINTLMFGEFANWTIRRWNTDWCNYFDDGREWWGTYLWTLVHDNLKHCVWIGASATD